MTTDKAKEVKIVLKKLDFWEIMDQIKTIGGSHIAVFDVWLNFIF